MAQSASGSTSSGDAAPSSFSASNSTWSSRANIFAAISVVGYCAYRLYNLRRNVLSVRPADDNGITVEEVAEMANKEMIPTGKHKLRIIGCGFQRCGSYSLKYALEELGFRTVHCVEFLEYTVDNYKWSDMKEWQWWLNFEEKLAAAKKNNEQISFDEYFGSLDVSYDALLDWPFCFYWKHLLQAYPDSKCILLTRDNKTKWHKSFMALYESVFLKPQIFKDLLRYLEPLSGSWGDFAKICIKQYGFKRFSQLKEDYAKEQLVSGIKNAENGVRQYFNEKNKSDQLLVFNIVDDSSAATDAEKWKVLCDFLDVEVPRDEKTGEIKPFPHKNQKHYLVNGIKVMVRLILRPYLKRYLMYLMAFVVILVAHKRGMLKEVVDKVGENLG